MKSLDGSAIAGVKQKDQESGRLFGRIWFWNQLRAKLNMFVDLYMLAYIYLHISSHNDTYHHCENKNN